MTRFAILRTIGVLALVIVVGGAVTLAAQRMVPGDVARRDSAEQVDRTIAQRRVAAAEARVNELEARFNALNAQLAALDGTPSDSTFAKAGAIGAELDEVRSQLHDAFERWSIAKREAAAH